MELLYNGKDQASLQETIHYNSEFVEQWYGQSNITVY